VKSLAACIGEAIEGKEGIRLGGKMEELGELRPESQS